METKWQEGNSCSLAMWIVLCDGQTDRLKHRDLNHVFTAAPPGDRLTPCSIAFIIIFAVFAT
jgi:hypothetical protein